MPTAFFLSLFLGRRSTRLVGGPQQIRGSQVAPRRSCGRGQDDPRRTEDLRLTNARTRAPIREKAAWQIQRARIPQVRGFFPLSCAIFSPPHVAQF